LEEKEFEAERLRRGEEAGSSSAGRGYLVARKNGGPPTIFLPESNAEVAAGSSACYNGPAAMKSWCGETIERPLLLGDLA
jgi:hypothetical protein